MLSLNSCAAVNIGQNAAATTNISTVCSLEGGCRGTHSLHGTSNQPARSAKLGSDAPARRLHAFVYDALNHDADILGQLCSSAGVMCNQAQAHGAVRTSRCANDCMLRLLPNIP